MSFNSSGGNGPEQKAVEAVTELDAPILSASNELNQLLKGAQEDYDARRYDTERRINQNTAMMYELRVHRSSADSDSHLKRSGFFFYCMLAAQAAVAISTFALAARKKGILWSLAVSAGLIAISSSAYVFTSM